MASPCRPHFFIAALLAASLGLAGHATAQQAQRKAPAAQPRPAFCVVNALEGQPVTADIRAGKAATKIQIPAGQNACCIKFCAENPAASGYQVTLTAQAAGAKPQQLCKSSLVSGRVLRVAGSVAQARCEEGRL